MRSTLELVLDLAGQVRELMRVELSLARTEVREGAKAIPSSLAAVAAGGVLLVIGLGLILVALSLALLQFGLPLDLSFCIVAVAAILVSVILMRVGASGLKVSRMVPTRSIAQISTLFGGR